MIARMAPLTVCLLIGFVASANADNDYYMKINSEWELGRIVKSPDGSQQKFVTCPGGKLFDLDQKNIKPSPTPCPKGSPQGPFNVTIVDVDTANKLMTIRYSNDTIDSWNIPSIETGDTQWLKLRPGKMIFLDVTDKFKKEAAPYFYTKLPDGGS